MAKIELTNDQLKIVQNALELYSRVGFLQLDHILYHPDIDNTIIKNNTQSGELKIGTSTLRGEIVEIGNDYIKTKGSWNGEYGVKEWKDIENIKLSPNWNSYHSEIHVIKSLLNDIYKIISKNNQFSKENEYSLKCYDMLQVIKYEFWKNSNDKKYLSDDSFIYLNSNDEPIKVQLDNINDIRLRKIKKINNE